VSKRASIQYSHEPSTTSHAMYQPPNKHMHHGKRQLLTEKLLNIDVQLKMSGVFFFRHSVEMSINTGEHIPKWIILPKGFSSWKPLSASLPFKGSRTRSTPVYQKTQIISWLWKRNHNNWHLHPNQQYSATAADNCWLVTWRDSTWK